jgi:hypothetical protein
MMGTVEKWAASIYRRFPAIRRTNPQLAAAFGFFLGGIGLGIYFRSFIDFIAPIAIAIVVSLVVVKLVGTGAALGWLAGAIIASLYGFTRSQDNNRRLDELEAGALPTMPASAKPS